VAAFLDVLSGGRFELGLGAGANHHRIARIAASAAAEAAARYGRFCTPTRSSTASCTRGANDTTALFEALADE
jgi:hypothetical protein